MARGTCIFTVFSVCALAANFVDTHPVTDESNNFTLITLNDINRIDNVTKTYMWTGKLSFLNRFGKPYMESEDDCPTNATNSDTDDFPLFLNNDQVKKGGIIAVIFIGVYGFSLLAVVCNDYFLPCVETFCEKLNITPDVAAATVMSIATSTPEFFTNVIGTFITKSDLGIGTIVGSSLYNALGVPAIGGLISPFALQLDWYPLTRDSLLYIISVTVLIIISWDGAIYWFETLIPLLVYIIYFIVMFNNKRIARLVKGWVSKQPAVPEPSTSEGDVKKLSKITIPEDFPRGSIMSAYGSYLDETSNPNYEVEHQKALEKVIEENVREARKSLFRKPEGTCLQKFSFFYFWPIKLILKCTIPNPNLHPNWFSLTFFMCIVWIGANSYLISWMISIIGELTQLPDALLGMTFMAVGSDLPETVSMSIIARRGEGAFGVSNSLGANTMNILYSLGFPWLLKNLLNGLSNDNPVRIQSGSIEYTIMSLLIAVVTLYMVLLINKFKLSKISGAFLGILYIVLVIIAILSQTVFFKQNC